MKLTLYCEQPETGRRARFFYDNLTSELLQEDGTPVVAHTNVDAVPADHSHTLVASRRLHELSGAAVLQGIVHVSGGPLVGRSM